MDEGQSNLLGLRDMPRKPEEFARHHDDMMNVMEARQSGFRQNVSNVALPIGEP
jgi:hypothetical protein